MGWTESPPAFSATTETITDLANSMLQSKISQPPHRLEQYVNTHVANNQSSRAAPPSRNIFTNPVAAVDVYVDDIIAMVQGDPEQRTQMTRTILHAIDRVFRPLEANEPKVRQEPVSIDKLRKGDGNLSTTKEILGWELNTLNMTISLKPRRLQRLRQILQDLPRTRKRIAVKEWHKIMGELRSMTMALPGCRGLFSALQFRFKTDKTRVRLTNVVHDFLDDFRFILDTIDERPMRIYELVPGTPTILGATDASGVGMGGVIFIPDEDSTPSRPHYHSFLWRQAFPDAVRDCLVTYTNTNGTITNSDLELAATIAQHDVIATLANVRERTIANLHDNTPTVYWNRKGSTTTAGPASYLLRFQALHQRIHKYISLHDFIPGHLNRMADDASRRLHMPNNHILNHFNTQFPQPTPWNLCHLNSETNSALISSLFNKRSAPASVTNVCAQQTHIGDAGWSSARHTTWTQTTPPETASPTCRSLPNDYAMDASRPAANPYDLTRFLSTYEMSGRRTHGWGPLTHGSTAMEKLTTD
jgi:hypothetical protein